MDEQAFEQIAEQIGLLSPEQFRRLVSIYASQSGQDGKRLWEKSVYQGLDAHLTNLGINAACPFCGSSIVVSNGYTDTGIQEFKCKDCSKTFNRIKGTLFERSRFPWEVWVEVLRSTLTGKSIQDTRTILEKDFGCDGISAKTVFTMRHKLIHAMASIEPPSLTGVLIADETFIRECQKAQKGTLISYLKDEIRLPRYGRHPSKLGTMGPEFATVLTIVDTFGRCVCALVALGRAPTDAVIDLYEKHCVDAAFLCSDGNVIYTDTCDLLEIPHYVRPSNYTKIIENAGYLYADETKTPEELRAHNLAVLERLYRNGEIDYIEHREDLTFQEFNRIKETYHLSLAKVNELHAEIKLMIEKEMTNVSTKYLPDYLALFQFRRNWRVAHGHAPISTKDAEDIMKTLLETRVNQTAAEMTAMKLEVPQPSGRAIQIQKEKQVLVRQITGHKYFKFDAEEVPSFNTRAILLDAPHSQLVAIAKEHKVKGYTKLTHWGLAAAIAKLPDAERIIIDLLIKNRTYMIDDEDVKYLQSRRYSK